MWLIHTEKKFYFETIFIQRLLANVINKYNVTWHFLSEKLNYFFLVKCNSVILYLLLWKTIVHSIFTSGFGIWIKQNRNSLLLPFWPHVNHPLNVIHQSSYKCLHSGPHILQICKSKTAFAFAMCVCPAVLALRGLYVRMCAEHFTLLNCGHLYN